MTRYIAINAEGGTTSPFDAPDRATALAMYPDAVDVCDLAPPGAQPILGCWGSQTLADAR